MKANKQKRVVCDSASHFGQRQKVKVVRDPDQSLPNTLSSVERNYKQAKINPGYSCRTGASFSTEDITKVVLFLILFL